MSTDLDQQIRSAMRHSADDAPASVDLVALHQRVDALARRRRAMQATGGAVLSLAALLAAASLTRTTAEQTPPASSSSPSPSVAPVTTADPVPLASPEDVPWTAWTTADAATRPQVLVRTSGDAVALTGTGDATTAHALAWVGTGHRTLVVALGSPDGVESLASVELAADGSTPSGLRPLVLGDGVGTTGRAVVDAAGGFVWLWHDPAGSSSWRAVRVDGALRLGEQQTLGDVRPVGATGDALIATTDDGRLVISLPTGSSDPLVCPGSQVRAVAVSARRLTASLCGDGTLGLSTALPVGGVVTSTVLRTAPPEGRVVQAWFTDDGQLGASTTRDDGTLATWVYDSDSLGRSTWRLAVDQGVLTKAFAPGTGVAFSLRPDSDGRLVWTADTDPQLQLGAGEAPAGDAQPTLVARPER